MSNITFVKILLLIVSGLIFIFDAKAGFISLVVMQGTILLLEYRKRKWKA
ncbi:hypothetical protein MATR_36390 [Marivirga tractuosa]|uniref:Uncharacterized protein n=1 Tax=Marivirga tractuosa (strain ATCC 23168 / DSM 4126 / NBRC 15989 / NCIMB 1408 / VKM B-1430 / H-43) TaxID=643867 RepID=E4TNV1_MARTH|nr:hypothetical protein [Marivirga tractuosa]ADR22515.1 hypothetical protein Ftrac_2537 [Marivirga tractuosa DSM 4126]BDD16814.1 hypothetical protein MATR_36390 [Marivirga tractuosa]